MTNFSVGELLGSLTIEPEAEKTERLFKLVVNRRIVARRLTTDEVQTLVGKLLRGEAAEEPATIPLDQLNASNDE